MKAIRLIVLSVVWVFAIFIFGGGIVALYERYDWIGPVGSPGSIIYLYCIAPGVATLLCVSLLTFFPNRKYWRILHISLTIALIFICMVLYLGERFVFHTSTTRIVNYERVVARFKQIDFMLKDVQHLPDTIPSDATNVQFYYDYNLGGRGVILLRFNIPAENDSKYFNQSSRWDIDSHKISSLNLYAGKELLNINELKQNHEFIGNQTLINRKKSEVIIFAVLSTD